MIDAGVKESIELDYKACAELSRQDWALRELSKDISALANSAGGTIVYGVKEFKDKDSQHLPEVIDVGYDPAVVGREWLEQQIHAKIHPRIDGLRINQVALSGDNQGNVIYVVHAPKSFR